MKIKDPKSSLLLLLSRPQPAGSETEEEILPLLLHPSLHPTPAAVRASFWGSQP